MDKGQEFCSEIWPPGCEKPDASNVLFERPLASHSPVAKSPLCATVLFLHFLSQPPALWNVCGALGRDVFGVELRKNSPRKVSPRKRLRKAPEKLEEKEDKASWPRNK